MKIKIIRKIVKHLIFDKLLVAKTILQFILANLFDKENNLRFLFLLMYIYFINDSDDDVFNINNIVHQYNKSQFKMSPGCI